MNNNINDWYIIMLHSQLQSDTFSIWDIQYNIEHWATIKHIIIHTRRLGEDIIILGTCNEMSILTNILLDARSRSYDGNVLVLDKGWVTGILTNKKTYREYAIGYMYTKAALTDKQIDWYETHRINIENWLLSKHHKLPSIRLVINAIESIVAMSEAKLCGVVTVGINESKLLDQYLDYSRGGNNSSMVSQLIILLIRLNDNVNIDNHYFDDMSIILKYNDVYINEALSN